MLLYQENLRKKRLDHGLVDLEIFSKSLTAFGLRATYLKR